MRSKGLIVFIVVAGIALIFYMKRSADDARKTSDHILEEFKTVDESLKQSTLSIDSANKALLDSINAKSGK